MTNLDLLPPEVIRLIVEHVAITDLYACTLINKNFFLAANPILWRSISFDTEPSLLKFITTLIESPNHQSLGKHVVEFYGNKFITNSVLMFLLPHVPRLQTLDLTQTKNTTDGCLQHVPRYCPNLTSLSLNDTLMTAPMFATVCQQLPQLRSLHLIGYCPGMTPDIFSHHDRCQCPLDDIVVSHGLKMTQQTVMDLTRFDGLTVLSILDQRNDILYQLLTTTTSHGNVPWPRLTHLQIGKYNVGDNKDDDDDNDDDGDDDGDNLEVEQALVSFIKSHHGLRRLLLLGNAFTDVTLDAIGMFLPNVFTAMMIYGNNGMTVDGLRRLVQTCGSLKRILLQRCSDVLEQGFPELVDGGVRLKYEDSTLKEIGPNAIKRIRQTPPHQATTGIKDDNNNDDGGTATGNGD